MVEHKNVKINQRLLDHYFVLGLPSDHQLNNYSSEINPDAETNNDNTNNANNAAATIGKENQIRIEERVDLHPLDYIYTPQALNQYPLRVEEAKRKKQSSNKNENKTSELPNFLSLFCFPDHFRLIHAENSTLCENLKTNGTWHSFIVTEESGRRYFGVCCITYSNLNDQQIEQFDKQATLWQTNKWTNSELE